MTTPDPDAVEVMDGAADPAHPFAPVTERSRFRNPSPDTPRAVDQVAPAPERVGRQAGDYGYDLDRRAPAPVALRRGEVREAPEGGSYLTPAEHTLISRLPHGQTLSPELAQHLLAVRRRVEGHGGRLPRHGPTQTTDLMLLDSLLAHRDTSGEEAETLRRELEKIDAALAMPNYTDQVAGRVARHATTRAVADLTAAENERYRWAVATAPVVHSTGQPDGIYLRHLRADHEANLARITRESDEVRQGTADDLRADRSWSMREARDNQLRARRQAVVQGLRKLDIEVAEEKRRTEFVREEQAWLDRIGVKLPTGNDELDYTRDGAA